MRYRWFTLLFLPAVSACAQSYAVRFPARAFGTKPDQRVVISTLRGRTQIRGVVGSRDIVVSGSVLVTAGSPAAADSQARAVRVTETPPILKDDPLVLSVAGIPSTSSTRFESEFIVPIDIRLEIRDGPEDLLVEGLRAGISIEDGAGDIDLTDLTGPVKIVDLDGNIFYHGGRGSVTVNDRRGDITIEEVTGPVEIIDREDDIMVQSVTGDLSLWEEGRGVVRINNVDGKLVIPKWNNLAKLIIDTVWEDEGPPAARKGAAPSAPAPAAAKVPPPAGGTATKEQSPSK